MGKKSILSLRKNLSLVWTSRLEWHTSCLGVNFFWLFKQLHMAFDRESDFQITVLEWQYDFGEQQKDAKDV